MRSKRIRWEDDSGVALIMALVFMLVVGLFLTVALEKNQATSASGQQVRERGQLQYTLDGAVDDALQTLRQELVDDNAQTCTDPADAPGSGSLSLNNHTANYICTTLGGRARTAADSARNTNYAIVVTSPGHDSFTSSNQVNEALLVSGSIYVTGPVTDVPGDYDLRKEIHVYPGDIVGNKTTSNCASWDAAFPLKLKPGTNGYQRGCTEQTTAEAYDVIAVPTAPTAPTRVTVAGCTIYFPGSYAVAPAFGNNTDNYLVSGVYRFQSGTLSVHSRAEVVGGQPAGTDQLVALNNSCSAMDDAAALLAPGAPVGITPLTSGVTLVFAGTSTFTNNGTVVLHSPPAVGAQPPVNVIAVGRIGDPYVVDLSDPDSTTLLNAKLYAPDAAVRFFANSATNTVARTGIVAKKLDIGAPSGSALAIYAPGGGAQTPPPPFRTVKIVSSDASGASGASNTAVATLSNFSPYTVRVLSWRTD